MATWTSYPLEGNYMGRNSMFSLDGSTLLIGDFITTMVFGIPNDIRSAWQPVTGHIVPAGVNVRTRPEQEAERIGFASGDVMIGGRDLQNSGVYLPELGGWVWSDPDFLDLGDLILADLPILAYSTE